MALSRFGSAPLMAFTAAQEMNYATETDGRTPALSRREAECLQWLAAGKTLGEAATIIGISERTLRFHVANARERLGVATTIQAVVAASLVYGFHPSDTRRSIYAISRTPSQPWKLKTG